jgi:hypothetical protein
MAKDFNKLNRPSIRKLLPGGKLTEHGITFERLKNGDGVYSVNVMADGRRIHRVIGREGDGVTRLRLKSSSKKHEPKHERVVYRCHSPAKRT